MRASKWFVLAVSASAALSAGCRREHVEAPAAKVELSITPSPAQVGAAEIRLHLATPDGGPLAGADVQLEGNMNHAGMVPTFARLSEREPGVYVGTLQFTMSGDWFILVSARTRDGRLIERKIDVPGVGSS